MYDFEIDISVALIFFSRPETLKKVFERVKKAKPSKLFLIQDGPRVGNHLDIEKIQKCREIVDDIDWKCEVFKNYSEFNLGCGLRPHTGITWVFEHVDKAIILEDDCVPSETFFLFCKEMLYRYQNDLRIGIVSGTNYFEEYDFGRSSYGFVKSGSIWGWATWKDRWQKYDFSMSRINDPYLRRLLMLDITPEVMARKRINTWEARSKEIEDRNDVSFWDYQWGFTRHTQSWLAIVPKYNQITNIGVGLDSTHSGNDINALPKEIADFFYMKSRNLEFPLMDPVFVLPDRDYDDKYYKRIYPTLLKKLFRRIEIIINRLKYTKTIK